MKGKLIVFEGIDGSGKTSQVNRLNSNLNARGIKTIMTRWNSSPIVSESIKNAKDKKILLPLTGSLLHAADMAERLNTEIIPALNQGINVISDRYFFTGLARDAVRGIDVNWLKNLYSFCHKPDIVIFLNVPIEKAINRVLARSELNLLTKNKDLELSEEINPDSYTVAQIFSKDSLIKYYEGGLDLKLSNDALENFFIFQNKVISEYDKMEDLKSNAINADRPENAVAIDVLKKVLPILLEKA